MNSLHATHEQHDSELTVEASYSLLWRWGLPFGLYCFVGVGGYLLYLVIVSPGPAIARLVILLVSGLFLYLAYTGVRLLPFCAAKITADTDGLRVKTPHVDRQYAWAEISSAVDHPGLQIFDVFSVDGTRVLSVDYYLINFSELRQVILERVGPRSL